MSLNGVFYPIAILFAKLSILFLYLRIFDVDRRLRLFIVFGMVFQALFYTAMVCLAIANMEKCNSPQKLSSQYCKVYSRQVSVMMPVLNVVTDIYVLALPIHRVLALKLSAKHRLGVLLIFLCGIGCVKVLSRKNLWRG